MLVRLLYASRAVDTSPSALEDILKVAREHNLDHGITGVLVYQGGVFLQALEGGRRAVNDLFGAIQRDPRHKDVELLLFEEIVQRSLCGWAMGLVDVDRVNPGTLLRYSDGQGLNPYGVSGRTSLAFIEDLTATAAICGHS